jgi:two-component system, OmpR family, sensor histidine kinase KdpD
MSDRCVETLRILGHELRRPLTVIRGASTLLVDEEAALPPETRQQMLALIDKSAAAMADLVDDLQTAVHLEAGDIAYYLEPVDLTALVEEALETARRERPERSVDVRGIDGMEVHADREHALRTIRALLVNALQFSPEATVVEVVASEDDDAVRVEVLDRGPGLPAADRERAFEKFSRLDPHAGGAGLGLFLARELARGMGGEVSVRDREDGGTAACFTLRRRG